MQIAILILGLFINQAQARPNCHALKASVDLEKFAFKDCMYKSVKRSKKKGLSLEPLARRCSGKVGIAEHIKRQLRKCDYRCPSDSFGFRHRGDTVDVCQAIMNGSKMQKEAKRHAAKQRKAQAAKAKKDMGLSIKGLEGLELGGALGAKGNQIGSGGLGVRGRGFGESRKDKGASGYGSKKKSKLGRIGGTPIILGSIDKSKVDKVIKKNMNRIRYCYQRQLHKHPNLVGKVKMKFTIGKTGSVSKAKVQKSSVGSKAVDSCLVKVFRTLKFPSPKGGGIAVVKYPFIFGR